MSSFCNVFYALIVFTIAVSANYNITDVIETVAWDDQSRMQKFLHGIICQDVNMLQCNTTITDLHQNPLSGGTGVCYFHTMSTATIRNGFKFIIFIRY